MVSFNVYRSTASGAYVEGVCLATDEKPITGIANGSILYAVDPTDGSTTRYMFDQSTATWIEAECPCSGGGSGGGSGDGGGTLVVHATEYDESGDPSAIDKTYGEIKAALDAGKYAYLIKYREVASDELPEGGFHREYTFEPVYTVSESNIHGSEVSVVGDPYYVVSFRDSVFYALSLDAPMMPGWSPDDDIS